MPHATTDDGVKLWYEEVGSGTPILFIHEFAGDHRSWEPQMRHFGRGYRAICYSARGYPPSDVPDDAASYGQDRARLDALAVLDHLGIGKAHICGLSMGGFATLHFGLHHRDRALSLVVAGCGYGAEPDKRAQFQQECGATATRIADDGMKTWARIYAGGPTRVQFENKDPRGWAEFRDQLSGHSDLGSSNTMRAVQAKRPSLYELEAEMGKIDVPTLILTGDEDWHCLGPGILMKRAIKTAGLAVMPNAGHTINLEAPDEFNRIVGDFFHLADRGRWMTRDPRAEAGTILGVEDDA